MNVATYVFGEFNNGYTQYLDDYTKPVFKKFYSLSKSETQIAIHRDGNLLYYGYIRKLENERHIGFCVVLNGLMLSQPGELFSLYENAITNLITNGQLIHFNEQGNIVANVESLHMNRGELDVLSETFRIGFKRLKHQQLPSVSFGVAKDSVKDFSIEDDIDDIVSSSHTYGYTLIYKSKGYNTNQLNSYNAVLLRVNDEKENLVKQNAELTKKNEEIKKQKKQYEVVGFLCIILIGCIIGLLAFNGSLQSKDNKIQSLNAELKDKIDSISMLTNTQLQLNRKVSSLNNIIEQKNSVINTQTQEIENYRLNTPRTYEVMSVANYYYRAQCGTSYELANCYSSAGNIISVYTIENGFGLTTNGWIDMDKLLQY